jgi:hypothetical protein
MSTSTYEENRCTTCTPYEGERYTALRDLLESMDSGGSLLLPHADEPYKKLYDIIAMTFDSSSSTRDGQLYVGYRPAYSYFLLSLLSHLESY